MNKPSSIRRVCALVVLTAALVGLAGAAPSRAEDVQVTIVAITASDRNQNVNPKLKEIASEVKKRDASLTGYKLERTTSKAVNVGQKESFALVDGATADITVLQKDDSRQRVRLALKAPLVGEITYSTCYDKFFPVVTRYLTTNDRERLIVAVMVKPVAKEKDKK
jgi:hypothetical protein